MQSIHLIAEGHSSFPYRSPKTSNESDSKDVFLKQFNFTKREFEIIQVIKYGHTNQQIAERHFLSIYNNKTYRKNIMQQLGLNTPSALMKFIVENNI
ncbi:MAG: LuxR C-terminal-related transcriptional regulator [Bacteroidota bacterium]